MYTKSILGQKAIMNCGMEAEVIEDNGSNNITIRFCDGCIVSKKSRRQFYLRKIINPNLKNRKSIVGKEKIMSNNMRAIVIEDNGAYDIKIQFEDGYIARCSRSHFKTGKVKNPNQIKGSLLGQKSIMNCGMEAEVIEDKGYNDITIRFTDGYTKKTKRQSFNRREVKNPNVDRTSILGHKLIMKCGMEAEVIEDNGFRDITVRFSDGYTAYHRERSAFTRRMISNPNCRMISFVGKKLMMCCGMEAEVIEDLGYKNITVKFTDGTILKNKRRDTFLSGHIKNPYYDGDSIKGRVAMMNCGMEAEVIEDFGDEDITVRFVDGTIKEHCTRHNFYKGKIGNPNLANNHSLPQTLIYYFIHNFFPDTISNYRPDWLRNRKTLANLEIDVWIPSKKIGIEYDGYRSHSKETQGSLEKSKLISTANEIKTMITVLERGTVVHTSPKHVNYQLDYVSEYNEYILLLKQLEKTINKILKTLGVNSAIEINDEIIKKLYYNIDPVDYRRVVVDNTSGSAPKRVFSSVLGQKAIMKCGMEAEVVEDNGSRDITVRFTDGYTKRTSRQSFARREIGNPNVRRGSLLGQEKVMNNKMRAKVIEDNGAFDLKIQFEDGYIAHCVRSTFKSGSVNNPNVNLWSLLGRVEEMSCGMRCEVIEDNGANDITVKFEDGFVKKSKRQAFKLKQIDNPHTHSILGKKLVMKCGMEAEVIEDKGYDNISVRFSDGTVVNNRSRYSFSSRVIDNPNYNKFSVLGQKAIMDCGMECEVIEDNGWDDITVKFSNGIVKKHCQRYKFKAKKLTPIIRRKEKL